MVKTNRLLWVYLFVVAVFILKLFDSLYIRSHGDPLNYHLGAPIQWADKGLLFVSTFQTTHFQAGWYEFIQTIVFKIFGPIDFEHRSSWLIANQILSCCIGFLAIPLFLVRRLRKTLEPVWCLAVLSVYYGLEPLFFTAQLAKNDVWAGFSFLIGALSPIAIIQAIGMGFAVGIKATYLYGALIWIALRFSLKKPSASFGSLVAIGFFLISVFIQRWLAAGSPVFPVSGEGFIGTSMWAKEFFAHFTEPTFGPDLFKKITVALNEARAFFVTLVIAIVISIRSRVKRTRCDLLLLAIPFYIVVTGPWLELRTYSGIFLVSLVLLFEKFRDQKNWVAFLVAAVGLSSSKIDTASFSRYLESRHKTYAQLTVDGELKKYVNDNAGRGDLLLTRENNEGYFLKIPLLTVNETPRRDEILEKYKVLTDQHAYIWLKTAESCDYAGHALSLIDALMSANVESMKPSENIQNLWQIELRCEGSNR